MQILKRIAFITCCSTLITNCSAPQFIALPEELKSQITSSEVLVEVPKDKIEVEIEKSDATSYLGGGLLPMLIASSIDAHSKGKAEKAVEEVQHEFKNYPMQQKLNSVIQSSCAKASWLNTGKIQFVKDLESQETINLIESGKADAVIATSISFSFTPLIDIIKSKLTVTVYPTSTNLKSLVKTVKASDKPILKFVLMATERLPKASLEIEENGQSWMASNGLLLRQSLDSILLKLTNDLDKTLKNSSYISDAAIKE